MPIQTWVCKNCNKECERVAVRGQKPRWCSQRCKDVGSSRKLCTDCQVAHVRRDAVRCSACAGALMTSKAAAQDAERRAIRRLGVIERMAHAAKGTSSSSAKADIACVICVTRFIGVWYGVSTNRTCSKECMAERAQAARREAKHRRRALQRNAYVAPVSRSKVYARDGWRCHLCGVKVQRNAVAPHPQAPTIDHIIPLAAGGTHEPANVATAHFICNSRKGARSSGEQLALIG